MLPKISVIMPCFNAVDFVSESIESILNQTFTDFELILIDDGSTDASLNIIKQYARTDSRILVIEQENTGQSEARNRGILASRGEWIAILDSDDLALPTRLEQQLAYLDKNPDFVMIGSDFIEIDGFGHTIKCHHYPGTHSVLMKRLQRIMAFPPHSSLMYRTEVVKRIGGFNNRYVRSEDWDLWLRLAEQGRVTCLNRPLVKVRKHANNISDHEGGRTQALYGLAASICHFLRCKGAVDPSAGEKDADWRLFIEWIELRVKQEMFYERQQEWSQMRRAYFSTSNRILSAWRLATGLATSRYAFQILHDKLFGSYLPIKLADEWIRKLNSEQ